MPYTYLIGWKSLDTWYYGVRYARGCHPNDFWVSYFTSSKYVKDMISIHGNPDIIEIRKTFDTPKKAKLWEEKVLRRMKVTMISKWLNKSISGGSYVMDDEVRIKIGKASKKMWENENHKQHISQLATGRNVSAETKAKLSAAAKRRYENPEERMKTSLRHTIAMADPVTKMKISKANLGKKRSPEAKQKMREAKLGKTPWNKGMKTSCK